MIDFEIGFVVGALTAVFVWCCYRAWQLWQKAPQDPRYSTLAVADASRFAPGDELVVYPATPKVDDMQFSVTGKPRTPWHVRRKELEEAARTKRKKLESYQEIT